MNVGIFTDNDFAKVNGVTTTLRAVLDHAPPHIRPRVYTCEGRDVDRPDYRAFKSVGIGIPYYREMKMYAPPFRRLLRQVIADEIDVIHCTTPGPVGLAALWVASRAGLPMVGSFHTHLTEYARILSGTAWLATAMQAYLRWLYARCRLVLAPSEATRQVLIDSQLDPERIGIWRRGVSTDQFTPAKRSTSLRRQWGVSDRCPALLYVGRLSREKGLSTIVPLQRALAGTSADHRIVFVGDGPMRRELEASCPGAVFTGTLAPDAVATAMASADVFLFPSTTDTAGNVVLEAQASGLPVVVTDIGGPHENLIPNVTGVVSSSADEFIRLTLALARNPNRRKFLGARARGYAIERTWEASLEPLYQAYAIAWAHHHVHPRAVQVPV